MFSWCFLSVLMYFSIFEIWAENRTFEPRTGFSRNSQKASKHVLLVFSGCFKVFFRIVRHLSREPDFWAENQIFKKFLNSLKTCLVCVFWLFHVFFLALFDIWAENRIFEPRTVFKKRKFKSLLTCLGGVFWMFPSIFSIVRHLSWEPDFWAKNRVFTNFVKWLETCLINMPSIVAVNR